MSSSVEIQNSPWHVPILDAVRGLAALCVVAAHFGQQFLPLSELGMGKRAIEYLGGWAVSIFFVLSGFLIHSGAIKEMRRNAAVDWRKYARRRFFRIFPAYLVALVASSIVGLSAHSNMISVPTIRSTIEHFFLISTFSAANWEGINAVLWTVIVECHFYLAYPLIFFSFARFGPLRPTLAVVGFSCAAFFLLTAISHGETRVMLQHTSPVLWWKWCLGALLAEMTAGRVLPRLTAYLRLSPLLPVFVVLSFAGIFIPGNTAALQFERFFMPVFAFLAVGACVLSEHRRRSFGPMRWVGEISYSIYLLHPLALLAVVVLSWQFALAQLSLAVLLTFALAAASYYAIERPFIRIGHRRRSSVIKPFGGETSLN